MKRTTISLPDDLAAALEREARRRRTTVSAVARQALVNHLHANRRPRFAFVGLGASGYTDTAERAEEILEREWADYIARDAGLVDNH